MCNKEMQDLLYWLHSCGHIHKTDAEKYKDVAGETLTREREAIAAAYWKVTDHIRRKMGYVLTDEMKRRAYKLDDETER